jgi:apolipoprotein N-acyltransferase
VCYEDVFPGLARRTAAAGADLLFVATNNGWFGETGAPCQHAAHSVLRAVETRRPVLRVGNGGWSGWIDEYGRIRDVLRNERQSIYHRGFAMFAIDRDARWEGRQTLYVRWGDWFVGLSAALAAAGWVAVRRAKRPD